MKLKIECTTKEERKVADEFLSWMCNQGEQDYWAGLEYTDHPLIIRHFKYDFKKLEIELELGPQRGSD